MCHSCIPDRFQSVYFIVKGISAKILAKQSIYSTRQCHLVVTILTGETVKLKITEWKIITIYRMKNNYNLQLNVKTKGC